MLLYHLIYSFHGASEQHTETLNDNHETVTNDPLSTTAAVFATPALIQLVASLPLPSSLQQERTRVPIALQRFANQLERHLQLSEDDRAYSAIIYRKTDLIDASCHVRLLRAAVAPLVCVSRCRRHRHRGNIEPRSRSINRERVSQLHNGTLLFVTACERINNDFVHRVRHVGAPVSAAAYRLFERTRAGTAVRGLGAWKSAVAVASFYVVR